MSGWITALLVALGVALLAVACRQTLRRNKRHDDGQRVETDDVDTHADAEAGLTRGRRNADLGKKERLQEHQQEQPSDAGSPPGTLAYEDRYEHAAIKLSAGVPLQGGGAGRGHGYGHAYETPVHAAPMGMTDDATPPPVPSRAGPDAQLHEEIYGINSTAEAPAARNHRLPGGSGGGSAVHTAPHSLVAVVVVVVIDAAPRPCHVLARACGRMLLA